MLLHLLRKHGFRTPLAEEESFISDSTVFLFYDAGKFTKRIRSF
jgi:hypothetical protein